MDQKLELSADTVLVKLYGGVTGITRRTNKEDEQREGKAVLTTREVTTRQADAAEAERARKLLNQLRSTVDKYTTTVLNLTVTTTDKLAAMRAEIAPIQGEIDTHNRGAKHHTIDRSLICAPISLKADPAAIVEVCRQVSDELKVARGFFNVEAHGILGADVATSDVTLDSWLPPVDNWIKRTKGLGSLFPTVTGQVIGEAIDSVRDLRKKVADSCRAFAKAGQGDESALRSALQAVNGVEGALGLLDTAIGLTAVVDSDAKQASEAARAEGAAVEVH